ncbi:MAG: hypothetical protein HZB42_09560 [Sphingobacteriales bacterium]|nr:hypothetical protein [Sphingobacteriales bacterium]
MKYLIAVLVIRFLIEVVARKNKNANVQKADMKSSSVRHPAEYILR